MHHGYRYCFPIKVNVTVMFKLFAIASVYFLLHQPVDAQSDYFPPENNAEWQVVSPQELGWDSEALEDLVLWLGENETRAFVILKDGKLVVEEYYRAFQRNTPWYWASAGKTVTALLTGALENQGLLDIQNPTSDYLGEDWTSMTREQEENITVWHQLTMTTGIEYDVTDTNCTLPECLSYREEPGEQWFYHNAPYTLLTNVLESAGEKELNDIVDDVFSIIPGMQLQYLDGFSSEFNRVVISRALDMARFGLFISRGAQWENAESVLSEEFYEAMISPSQDLNPSYGYLWWLNGQESFIPPGFSFSIQRSLTPEAPADMYSAVGLNAQILSIVPSQDLVVIRMGADPGSLFEFKSEKWERLNNVLNINTSTEVEKPKSFKLEQNYPNPFNPVTNIRFNLASSSSVLLEVYDTTGRLISTLISETMHAGNHTVQFDASNLNSGVYFYRIYTPDGSITRKMVLVK